jgi:hypothetical protein
MSKPKKLNPKAATTPETAKEPKPLSKKAIMLEMLERPEGASIQQLQDATGWQQHSVRGALVNLKNKDKKPVISAVEDGTRRYRLGQPQTEEA